jgi:hypothetical protein
MVEYVDRSWVACSWIPNCQYFNINGVYKGTYRFLSGDDDSVKAANVTVVKDGVQGGCLVICLQ